MDSSESNRWDNLIDLQPNQLLKIAILGASIGAASWLLALFLKQIVFEPILCGDAGPSCASAIDISGIIAGVVAGLVGLMGLVRLSVYRPLLIILAVAVSLWGLNTWVSGLVWYEAISWSILLYGAAYTTFAWLVRPRAFVPVVVVVAVVVFLARLLAAV